MTSRSARCIRAEGVPAILAGGQPVAAGADLTVIRSYWYNGEGWLQLRAADGRQFESPDVFYAVDGDDPL